MRERGQRGACGVGAELGRCARPRERRRAAMQRWACGSSWATACSSEEGRELGFGEDVGCAKGEQCWAPAWAYRPKKRGGEKGGHGPKERRRVFFSFYFIAISKPFKSKILIHFDFESKPLTQTNHMQWHECITNVSTPYDKFYLMKNYYFPMFSWAPKFKITSIYIYFKRSNFRVL